MPPMIEIEALAMASRRRHIGPFALRVEAGETVGLVGPNGSGKTTCIRLTLGLDRSDRGRSRIHGRVVSPWHPPTGVGVVLEADGCYPWLSGRENLRLFAQVLGRPAVEIDAALEQVGLTPAADQTTRQYSRGMRQRLAFARASLGGPSLFVLDEPTVALDGDAGSWLVELLNAHAVAGGATLVASHDETFLHALGARIVAVDDGRCG